MLSLKFPFKKFRREHILEDTKEKTLNLLHIL